MYLKNYIPTQYDIQSVSKVNRYTSITEATGKGLIEEIETTIITIRQNL